MRQMVFLFPEVQNPEATIKNVFEAYGDDEGGLFDCTLRNHTHSAMFVMQPSTLEGRVGSAPSEMMEDLWDRATYPGFTTIAEDLKVKCQDAIYYNVHEEPEYTYYSSHGFLRTDDGDIFYTPIYGEEPDDSPNYYSNNYFF